MLSNIPSIEQPSTTEGIFDKMTVKSMLKVDGDLFVNGSMTTVDTTVINKNIVKTESIDSKESFVGLLQRILDSLEEKNGCITDLMRENEKLREIKSSILDILGE